jgi:hypothetical protein
MFESSLKKKRLGYIGAGEETQTPGLFLGKEALYQLSYTRAVTRQTYGFSHRSSAKPTLKGEFAALFPLVNRGDYT